MIPAAVWKSSYRLIFGEKSPVLEGWAIVDNTTGEDWTKVQLSLVSGRPISFVSQLYAPKYVQRPDAELADDTAARPVVHSGAFEPLSEKKEEGRAEGRAAATDGRYGSAGADDEGDGGRAVHECDPRGRSRARWRWTLPRANSAICSSTASRNR